MVLSREIWRLVATKMPAHLLDVTGDFSQQTFEIPGRLRMTSGDHLLPCNYRGRHNLILAGDHICAVMKNHPVIFETPQND